MMMRRAMLTVAACGVLGCSSPSKRIEPPEVMKARYAQQLRKMLNDPMIYRMIEVERIKQSEDSRWRSER